MHKFIAIGDVHADFELLWEALRSASCMGADFLPTPPLQAGMYQVVLIGDLVHPKNQQAYNRLTGLKHFDFRDQEHLLLAAREQIKQLERLKAYQTAAPHAIHILLGNHDENAIRPHHVLGTSGGLRHVEFDPSRGGAHLPAHLAEWMGGFPRELRVGNMQFAHVSPLPAHQFYDDLFYTDRSTKRWFTETPEYVEMAGLSFGIYGHTQIDGGIYLHSGESEKPLFAMIDALHAREYLEIMCDERQPAPLTGVNTVLF
ncbi:hypothetical protein Dxin01_02507 [Deinococcus xinjiangensis]|uniref:Calcineurin-like phosphoesterase domain-containing protein n=1 Tax=Deinococcus xinjiangensis TaxID=457454 RepID=A0ABP9VEV7_9DEIO